MSRLRLLEDFLTDVTKWHEWMNETGMDKDIQIIDSEQELEWFGKKLEKVKNWVNYEIEEENRREDEALPDEGDEVMWRVGQ